MLSVQYDILSDLFKFTFVFTPTAFGSCKKSHRACEAADNTSAMVEILARQSLKNKPYKIQTKQDA